MRAYRDTVRVMADLLDDTGDGVRADRRRRVATVARTRGVLWPHGGDLGGVSPHQAEAVTVGLTEPVCLLTGTPGTGKTYTAAAVLAWLAKDRVPTSRIRVCAPTGKAALRITETMHQYGLTFLRATTVHSLLEIGRNGHDGKGWGFRRNADNPIDATVIVVDEASMLDTPLASSLMDAVRPGTHVLFVGDPYQLPPVGHGAPLRDMIAAGLPNASLSEVMRNAGGIVSACARLRQGMRFDATATTYGLLVDARDNLFRIQADGGGAVAAAIRTVIDAHQRNGFFNPMTDCQVLCATNKGTVGREGLNTFLQGMLNHAGPPIAKSKYRVGDKVVCLKNGAYEGVYPSPAQDAYLVNGEGGFVTGVTTDGNPVAAFGSQRITFPRNSPAFDLGYALTVHKAQGSEWPVAIVAMDDSGGARMVASREWLYTAMSRASRSCVLIGRWGDFLACKNRPRLEERKTFLREMIREEQQAFTARAAAAWGTVDTDTSGGEG